MIVGDHSYQRFKGVHCVFDILTTISHGFKSFCGSIGILGIITDYKICFPIKDLKIFLSNC
jgi:hypothetical protein